MAVEGGFHSSVSNMGGVNLVLLHVGALFVPGSLLIMFCGGGGGLSLQCIEYGGVVLLSKKNL